MDVTHEIAIDLLKPRRNLIHVVQEDSTRKIRLTLLKDNLPYNVAADLPSGETLLSFVEFLKSDGHGGMYDTTSLGETAVALEDPQEAQNVWIVALDGQCFTAPGFAQINVRFETESGRRLHTFPIFVDVGATASSDTESTDWGELNSIADMKAAITAMFDSLFPLGAKRALMNLVNQLGWEGTNGQHYIDELEAELFQTAEIVSISAAFDQGSAVVYDTDDLDTLKQYLTVTATYEDLSTREITGYTLSGTLTEGTSTITVEYAGKTTTFTASITSYKDRMFYSMSSGLIKKLTGTFGSDTTHGYYISTGNTKRRAFVFDVGDVQLETSPDNTSFSPSGYYPIPIPDSATEMSVSITPSTQFIAAIELSFSDGKYTQVVGSGWQQGSYSVALQPGQNRFFLANSKYNSAGSSYPTEPTEMTVTFS